MGHGVPQAATVARTGPGAAFFDVDETLITLKSMFAFLEYHYRECGYPAAAYTEAVAWLHGLLASGMPRAQANLKYYELFAGHDARRVAEVGEAWFAAELRGGALFRPAVLDALAQHRAAGELIVLVSGSFAACLEPIRRHVRADVLLCTVPEVVDDRYTGRVLTPMIGDAKAAAVRGLMTDRSLRPQDCHAYGDHASDLPLLEAVANPVVVGDDPVLLEHARARSWRRLTGAPAQARERTGRCGGPARRGARSAIVLALVLPATLTPPGARSGCGILRRAAFRC
jgi:HAD superfamily hydrolase (TIGR01490 family)